MSFKERLSGIWLMSMTLLSLFAFTVYFVAQMWLSLLQNFYLTLAILQIVTLILYLWGPEKLKNKLLIFLYRALYLTSFLVLPSFLFIFTGLTSQYHVRIPDAVNAADMPVEQILPKDQTVVYNNGTVYIIFPAYSEIEHVCEHRPSKSDPTITWCSGSAVSAALGVATADKLAGKDNYTIAVVGDGSFTNGMVYEALNNCNNKDVNLIIILNDNNM